MLLCHIFFSKNIDAVDASDDDVMKILRDLKNNFKG